MTQLTANIERAQVLLADFDAEVSDRVALGRLVAASPTHPLYVGYWSLRAMASLMGIATCAAFAVPQMSDYALDVLAAFPVSAFLPVATTAAAVAFAVAAVAMRQAAIARGRGCPLLPEEQRSHLALVSKFHQLSAARAVRDRTTPAPAAVRITADAA